MNYIIRASIREDIASILDIINQAILHTTATYDYEPHTLAEQTQWWEQRVQDKMPILVAELDNKVVGFGSYSMFRPRTGYKYSVEHSVYVAEAYRGQKIGKQLLIALIAAAKQQQLHTMIAGIDAKNQLSIALHQQFGFVEVGRCKEVGFKFGKWLDCVFMQLML